MKSITARQSVNIPAGSHAGYAMFQVLCPHTSLLDNMPMPHRLGAALGEAGDKGVTEVTKESVLWPITIFP